MGIFDFQSSICMCKKHLHLPASAPDSALAPALGTGDRTPITVLPHNSDLMKKEKRKRRRNHMQMPNLIFSPPGKSCSVRHFPSPATV